MIINRKHIAWLALLLFAAPLFPSAADEEALGQTAEKAGKLRPALLHYIAAQQTALSGTDTERRLREKILRLAPRVKPPPDLPEAAERSLARGEAALENGDFAQAAAEFGQALEAAPWWGKGYGQLALAQEKAADYPGAIRSLKLHKLTAATPAEAKEIQLHIYKLEYKQEHAAKALEAQQRAEREKAEARLDLNGFWHEAQGGGATYKIESSGNHFDIYRVSYCFQGNCNDQRSVHERLYSGLIDEGGITGTREEPAALDHMEMIGTLMQSCPVPAGSYPMTGTLSSDGNSLILHVIRQSRNSACPATESHQRFQREK
jgi:tetratricopeptide (TPR) repeat protein